MASFCTGSTTNPQKENAWGIRQNTHIQTEIPVEILSNNCIVKILKIRAAITINEDATTAINISHTRTGP